MENSKDKKKEGIIEKILVKISKAIVKSTCSCCSEKNSCRGKKCNKE